MTHVNTDSQNGNTCHVHWQPCTHTSDQLERYKWSTCCVMAQIDRVWFKQRDVAHAISIVTLLASVSYTVKFNKALEADPFSPAFVFCPSPKHTAKWAFWASTSPPLAHFHRTTARSLNIDRLPGESHNDSDWRGEKLGGRKKVTACWEQKTALTCWEEILTFDLSPMPL